MQIWIDGDACPNKIKEILFKAAVRAQTTTVLVSNHFIKLPTSPFIKRILVGSGFDVADQRIVQEVKAGDLVITADIPLADEVVKAGAFALSPRGKLFTTANIKQALAMRDFYSSLRESGMHQSGEDKISPTEIRQFANQLDSFLRA